MDDLEMMMRDFQMREVNTRLAEVSGPQQYVDRLSQLRHSCALNARSVSAYPGDQPSGFDAYNKSISVATLFTVVQSVQCIHCLAMEGKQGYEMFS